MLKFLIKKSVFFVAVLLIFSVACRSDEENDSDENVAFYLKAKFNGEQKNFPFLFSSIQDMNETGQARSFGSTYLASSTIQQPYPQVSFKLRRSPQSTEPFSVGTYSENNAEISFIYRTSVSESSSASEFSAPDFTFVISEFKGNRIKGTFSGTLQNNAGEKIVIEEGEFLGFNY